MPRSNKITTSPTEAPLVEASNEVTSAPAAEKVKKWTTRRLTNMATGRAALAFRRASAVDTGTTGTSNSAEVTALEAEIAADSSALEALRQTIKDKRARVATLQDVGSASRQARGVLLLEGRAWRAGEVACDTLLDLIDAAGESVLEQGSPLVQEVYAHQGTYIVFDRVSKDTYRVSKAMREMAQSMRTQIAEMRELA